MLRLLRDDETFGPALANRPESEALAGLRTEYARMFLLNVPPYGDFRDIARYLVTPALAGFYLSREELFRIAGQLRLPLALVERRVMLAQLFDQAARYELLDDLLAWLEREALRVASVERQWEQRYPAAAPTLGHWRRLAQTTATGLARMRTLAVSGAS